jgi:DNA-directed RNA polymerase specialized sigma24 family protein
MQAGESRASNPDATPPDAVHEAFRDLHARRLHGFALLLVLGDRPAAARLASDALQAAGERIGELRHPERAAAWLRARVVRMARGIGGTEPRRSDRVDALDRLGVDAAVFAGLEALSQRERAALIATAIERLDRRDAATIVDSDSQEFDRLVTRARRRYAAAHGAAAPEVMAHGPLGERVRAIAQRAMT